MTLPTDPAALGIDAARMQALVTELCALGRKLPGSDAEKAACAIITRELAAAGVAATSSIAWPRAWRRVACWSWVWAK